MQNDDREGQFPSDDVSEHSTHSSSHQPRVPRANQPLNAEPRPVVGSVILTVLLVAAVVAIIAVTVVLAQR